MAYSGGGHGNLICELCIFKRQKTGHDLDCTSGEKYFICILGIENGIGGILHDYSRFGRNIGSLGPSGNGIGRYGT